VEEGEVALAQGLHPGVALQRAGEAGEGAPAALHLLFDRLHLPGQQGLKAEGAALLTAEGGALVERRLVEQGNAAQGGADRSGHRRGRRRWPKRRHHGNPGRGRCLGLRPVPASGRSHHWPGWPGRAWRRRMARTATPSCRPTCRPSSRISCIARLWRSSCRGETFSRLRRGHPGERATGFGLGGAGGGLSSVSAGCD
jgi:hypothetical protein